MLPSSTRVSVWKLIHSDQERFRVTDGRGYLAQLVMCPAVIACITYRIGHAIWAYDGSLRALLPLFKVVWLLGSRFSEITTGIWIAPQAEIGPGLYIGHFSCIFVNAVKMGTNCNLSQGVTIGAASRGKQKGVPEIGNRVYIGPGAKLFGKITIGDDVAIGANAVVTKSLPDRAVAVGIPAKPISSEGSFEYILYAGMESDPDRLASFALREVRSEEAVPA